MSILILYVTILYNNNLINNKFNLLNKIYYWIFINNFILLTWLGKQLIEYPFTNINLDSYYFRTLIDSISIFSISK